MRPGDIEDSMRQALRNSGIDQVLAGGVKPSQLSAVDLDGIELAQTGYDLDGGLVDVHCHLGLGPQGATDRQTTLAQAASAVSAGILGVRDCGAPTDTHWLDAQREAGALVPRLVRAGRHIARPKRYLRGFALELERPQDLPEAVATQARAGDGWVKVVGDWIDRSLGAEADITPLWDQALVADAVAAAHENGARITVHTFAHATLNPWIEAGVDCFEHATGADSDQIQEMAARAIAVTPTFLQVDKFPEFAAQAGAKYPRYAATVTALHAGHEQQVAAMYEAGVRLLPGSDAGGSLPHNSLPRELLAWRRAGISDSEIMRLATVSVREFLGLEAHWLGSVTYEANPAENLQYLLNPLAVNLSGAGATQIPEQPVRS